MTIPYVVFGNDTLNDCPEVKEGDEVHCPRCNQRHILKCCTSDGKKSTFIMTYQCGGDTYLGAVKGRLVVHAQSDGGGEM